MQVEEILKLTFLSRVYISDWEIFQIWLDSLTQAVKRQQWLHVAVLLTQNSQSLSLKTCPKYDRIIIDMMWNVVHVCVHVCK